MEQVPSITQSEPQYSIQQLEQFIALYQHIKGEKLEVIKVSPDFKKWYQERMTAFGKGFGFTEVPKKLMFNGVEIK